MRSQRRLGHLWPQKGATPAIVVELDTALLAYSRLAAQFFGQDLSTLPGAGAAGGTRLAFAAFLHANLQPGAELVIEATGLEQALSRADLVVTGEGRLDGQSAMGKTPCAIAAQAQTAWPSSHRLCRQRHRRRGGLPRRRH